MGGEGGVQWSNSKVEEVEDGGGNKCGSFFYDC